MGKRPESPGRSSQWVRHYSHASLHGKAEHQANTKTPEGCWDVQLYPVGYVKKHPMAEMGKTTKQNAAKASFAGQQMT